MATSLWVNHLSQHLQPTEGDNMDFSSLWGQGSPVQSVPNNLYGTDPASLQQAALQQQQMMQQVDNPNYALQPQLAQQPMMQQPTGATAGLMSAGQSQVNPTTAAATGVTNPATTAQQKLSAANIPQETMQQALMLRMAGRDDLAKQVLAPYTAQPEQSTFGKWKDILTGKENNNLSDVEGGVQASVPILVALMKELQYNKNMGGVANMMDQRRQQVGNSMYNNAVANMPGWGQAGKVLK